jgi:hypothetical protein
VGLSGLDDLGLLLDSGGDLGLGDRRSGGGDNLILGGKLGLLLLLVGLLLEVTENVVENKVAVGLLGEEEGLGEFAPGLVGV